jgi:hypothetical protein
MNRTKAFEMPLSQADIAALKVLVSNEVVML